MSPIGIMKRLRHRYERDLEKFFFRHPFKLSFDTPVISFTFDDFPRSALLNGGEILKDSGLSGTYYVSLGLMGTQAPTGTMFVQGDLEKALADEHELGCHSFSHSHAWFTKPSLFEQSIVDNKTALETLYPGSKFRTFSYPVSSPSPQTKRLAARYFVCSRSGGQTFNSGTIDLNSLRAFFIDQRIGNTQSIMKVIDQCCDAKGWLILATHDVDTAPTQYGCTTSLFRDVVRHAVGSGARILPVIRTWEMLANGSAKNR
jgi:peptidoglycan/xylan/chitin deacetylase (PgdA/CDA1 family)